MDILRDTREEDCWVTGTVGGHWVEAKISGFEHSNAMEGGHVVRLFIGPTAEKPRDISGLIFHYDRGSDIDLIGPELLKQVLRELDELPPVNQHKNGTR